MDPVIVKVRSATNTEADRSTFLYALGLDSLELTELLHELDVPNSAIPDLDTVGDVADFVAARASR